MVANHSTVDKFLQVSLFGCLGGKGAAVIATDMDAGIVSRHLAGKTAAGEYLRHLWGGPLEFLVTS